MARSMSMIEYTALTSAYSGQPKASCLLLTQKPHHFWLPLMLGGGTGSEVMRRIAAPHGRRHGQRDRIDAGGDPRGIPAVETEWAVIGQPFKGDNHMKYRE